jgi:voltage-gated potassium channel
MSILLNIFRKVINITATQKNYNQAVMIFLSLIILGSLSIYYLERNINEHFLTFGDALWWTIVTITTVGYGDKYPLTTAGKVIAVIVMFGGIASFGYVAGSLLENIIKKGQGKVTIIFESHYIICSYSFKADIIINELKSELRSPKTVLIADRDVNPLNNSDGILFVRGDSTKEVILQKANARKAKTVIILADNKMDDYIADSHSILTALAIRHMNPSCKIIVESLNPENIDHFRRAGADEIICTGDISSKLIFRSSIYSGVTNLFRELLTNDYGNEIYSGIVPDYLINVEFGKALKKLKDSEAILIGIYRKDIFLTNPPTDFLLQKGDFIIYIAQKKII